MLKLENISLTFNPGTVNEKKALEGLNLHLEKGDFVTVLGSIVYRFIIAIALRLDLPSECLKLISATIVAVSIGLPAIKAAMKAPTKGGKEAC